MVKVGINGAGGRIGSSFFRELLNINGLEITAVNEPRGIDFLVEEYGKFSESEKVSNEVMKINGNNIAVYREKDASKIPWHNTNVRIVEECSGFYVSGEGKGDARLHLGKGVERVIVSAPAVGDGLATLIMGVNHNEFDPDKHDYISNASCTTKALAMPLAVLKNSELRVDGLLMDTVHASTTSQEVLSTLDNIGLTTTGAAKTTGLVLPELAGKMDGFSLRVPTRDGSFANAYAVGVCGNNLSVENLNQFFYDATFQTKYENRLGFNPKLDITSRDDVVGKKENGIVMGAYTRVLELPYNADGGKVYLVGFVSGYDNELGPPRDQALLTKYIAEKCEYLE